MSRAQLQHNPIGLVTAQSTARVEFDGCASGEVVWQRVLRRSSRTQYSIRRHAITPRLSSTRTKRAVIAGRGRGGNWPLAALRTIASLEPLTKPHVGWSCAHLLHSVSDGYCGHTHRADDRNNLERDNKKNTTVRGWPCFKWPSPFEKVEGWIC